MHTAEEKARQGSRRAARTRSGPRSQAPAGRHRRVGRGGGLWVAAQLGRLGVGTIRGPLGRDVGEGDGECTGREMTWTSLS